MKILVRAVGKMRDRRLQAVCDEYVDRARRHVPVEVQEVADDADLCRGLTATTEIIAFHPDGSPWPTAKLTTFVNDRMLHGTKAVAFLIGGADGLSKATLARASARVSLTALTLPHRLARVIVCEQIYRALATIRGEPYPR